jgi:hypothetical protein
MRAGKHVVAGVAYFDDDGDDDDDDDDQLAL